MIDLRRALVFAPLLATLVLAGCGSVHPPKPLSAAQAAQLQTAPSLGSVAIEETEVKAHGENLRRHLESTGLFRAASLAGAETTSTDWTARIDARCSGRRGGWIPLVPILTLGVVPQFARMELGYTFTLRETATGREIQIPCGIKATIGVGWIPALMNVLPGWTLNESEESPAFQKQLAYAIASRATGPAATER
jgi:hypothetical protein